MYLDFFQTQTFVVHSIQWKCEFHAIILQILYLLQSYDTNFNTAKHLSVNFYFYIF